MTVKKQYAVGDTVWIYGINRSNAKPVQGKVVKVVDLSDAGYSVGDHYIIEVPTHIEPILEIRTWHNISQDERGPVGSLRNLGNFESTIKFAGTVGFAFDDNPALDSDTEEDGPSSEEIHAALQKSQMDMEHAPLDLKASSAKPKRRYFKKKKA
jgi:hypothetical protein